MKRKSFVHDKSSFISQFISGKSRNLQKLLRYLIGIVTSAFKADTSGYGGRGGLLGVFLTIFVLYLNDLQSEVLSSTSSIS